MKNDDLTLSSVNWEHGMLLTPEHFQRQERYFDSQFMWAMRFTTTEYGLVGGGPRLAESERGASRHDPIVVIDIDDAGVSVSVTQCRALTPAGCVIEVDPGHPVRRQFTYAELEGVAEAGIHIVCNPHEKQPVQGVADDFNPQMMTERLPAYSIALQVPAEWVPYSVTVGRMRRPRQGGAGYEKDTEFIPMCTSMVGCSALASAGRQILETVIALAQRYNELHRAMQEFLVLFKERGIETELDVETRDFVGRMVAALQNCTYEILDHTQSPQRFFSALRRFFHNAAVYLDLSPPVRQFFEMLKETGESEFIALLDQQKKVLAITPRWHFHDDLGVEVRASQQALSALQRLERALEGKYIDFRTNRQLEAMNFVFDRGGKVLYKLAAKPSRVQGFAEELTMTFAQLRLEGREKYRLVLVGSQNAVFEKGTKITTEIRINEGAGFKRRPLICSCESHSSSQCNFEFDFDAQDVPMITDIRASLPSHHPFRTAMLFVRQRFYSGGREEQARHVEPEGPPAHAPTPPRVEPPPPAPRGIGLPEAPPREGDRRPPWEAPDRGKGPSQEPPGGPPPRRRRLE